MVITALLATACGGAAAPTPTARPSATAAPATATAAPASATAAPATATAAPATATAAPVTDSPAPATPTAAPATPTAAPETPTPGPATPTPEAVTLTLLTDNSQASVAKANGVIGAYTAKNPHVTILLETRPQGNEGDNVVKTRLATGDMTDIFWYNSGSLLAALKPDQTLVDLVGGAVHRQHCGLVHATRSSG